MHRSFFRKLGCRSVHPSRTSHWDVDPCIRARSRPRAAKKSIFSIFQNLKIFVKFCGNFCKILKKFCGFLKDLQKFAKFAKKKEMSRNLQNLNIFTIFWQKFAKFAREKMAFL